MHRLRQSKAIARWVLLWFALFVGAATAAPLIAPQQAALVCSGGSGLQWVNLGDDAGPAPGPGELHCPLCLPMLAPPSPVQLHFTQAEPHLLRADLPASATPMARWADAAARAPPLA